MVQRVFRLFFSEFYFISGEPALVFISGCVVLTGGIYIGVSQNIRNEVDIPGFSVQISSVCTPQFMRRDRFDRIDDRSVLLHEVFDGAHAHAFHLKGEE